MSPGSSNPIKSLWEAEEALTQEQRRARYKCGKKYVTEADVVRWESYHIEKPDRSFNKRDPVSDSKTHRMWFHNTFAVNDEDKYSCWKEDPILNSKVALWAGNITTLEIDAVLNAANTSLLGGGGIDGAIHAAAGKQLYKECEMLHGCKKGEAKITRGYNLPAKYVIATVGPIGEIPEVLNSAYLNSLEIAKKIGIRTFALCGVSTGIYGYPLYAASHIALATVRKWLESNHEHVDLIIFCTFLPREQICYENLMSLYFPRSSIIPTRSIQQAKLFFKGEEQEGDTKSEVENEEKPKGEEEAIVRSEVENEEANTTSESAREEKSEVVQREQQSQNQKHEEDKKNEDNDKDEENEKNEKNEKNGKNEENEEKRKNEKDSGHNDISQLADLMAKSKISASG